MTKVEIPIIPITVRKETVEEDIRQVIAKLRPNWKPEHVQLKIQHGGR